MNYIEVCFNVSPKDPFTDILVSELEPLPYDTFAEVENGLLAYIPEEKFDERELKNIPLFTHPEVKVSFTIKRIPVQNWNEEWEKNFQPIEINNECVVRAEFHAPHPDVKYEIIITPKMSFGTGHHATTSLMVTEMLKMDFNNKSVLDMGCGTGILAILAWKMKAKDILAIDIDEWPYFNTIENATLNNAHIKVLQGDVKLLESLKFNIILANINRNVLLDDMRQYADSLLNSGELLLSGFYSSDTEILKNAAKEFGLKFVNQETKDSWALLHFHKD